MSNKLKLIKEILTLPKVTIEIIDNDTSGEVEELYKYFNKRHPKYKIIRNKTLGVMLFNIPKTVEEYESLISGKNSVMYYSRRCTKLGYYTDYFIKNKHLDDMYDINVSSDNRQGRSMSKQYLEEVPKEEKKEAVSYFGVFTSDKKLVGYIRIINTPNLYVISQLLGHDKYQNDNIMYLILHDLITSLIEKNKDNNKEVYLMYDTYFGGSQGIKLYKKRHAFKPYKVKWKYSNEK